MRVLLLALLYPLIFVLVAVGSLFASAWAWDLFFDYLPTAGLFTSVAVSSSACVLVHLIFTRLFLGLDPSQEASQ